MRIAVFAVGLLLVSTAAAQAQTEIIESYLLEFYDPGATTPRQIEAFGASLVQCNQTAPSGGSTVNPTKAVWNDPNNAGKVCIYTPGAGTPLFSLPVGNYEATLSASNSAGGSPRSARATFSRQTAPSTPSGFRFVR